MSSWLKFIGVVLMVTAFLVIGTRVMLSGQTYLPTMPTPGTPGAVAAGTGISITGTWPNQTITTTESSSMLGATASIGGSLLALGGCNTADVTISGATTSMVAVASPATSQPNGVQWQAAVISANTVRVYECALLSVTPPSSTFNVRVIP